MSRTVHQNAVSILAETPFWHYCVNPSNLAFYDFTRGKIVPPAATSLLGLSAKFIVKPEYTGSPNDTKEALDRLERDLHLKIFFSGVEPEEPDKPRSKLRIKSDWRPDIQDVPHFVDTRLERFSKALAKVSSSQGQAQPVAQSRRGFRIPTPSPRSRCRQLQQRFRPLCYRIGQIYPRCFSPPAGQKHLQNSVRSGSIPRS